MTFDIIIIIIIIISELSQWAAQFSAEWLSQSNNAELSQPLDYSLLGFHWLLRSLPACGVLVCVSERLQSSKSLKWSFTNL